MQKIARTAGYAAVVALALAASACGRESSSIITPSPDPRPATSYFISGVITEATEDGQMPIEGALVENAATGEMTVSDAEGFFTLRVPAGLALLLVSKEGYEATTLEREVAADERVDVVMARQADAAATAAAAWNARRPTARHRE